MITLGISGFEDLNTPDYSSAYSVKPRTVDDLLAYCSDGVPLQGFPLHMIGHDSAAALLVDGQLVAFSSEERLTRIKHGFNLAGRTVLPRLAVDYCLQEAGITFEDVDTIAHYCRFEEKRVSQRLEAVAVGLSPPDRRLLADNYNSAYRNRLSKKVLLQQLSEMAGFPISEKKLVRIPHHMAHAAGAFYSSGFREAVVLTVDGFGEVDSAFWGLGNDQGITPKGAIALPTSLGVLYQIVTTYLGFRSFGDEYKVMGLASYGDPRPFSHVFDQIVTLLPEGRFELKNISRPDFLPWLREMLGRIDPLGDFSGKAADIAAALQQTLERTLLHLLSALSQQYPVPNLCLSGGVALNACANGAILRSGLFENVFIQPAAGDDGAALGAAFCACQQVPGHCSPTPVHHVYWGMKFDDDHIEKILNCSPVRWRKETEITVKAAELLEEGKILAWFQGRGEMGPRALGARSILADPRSTELRDKLNATIKNREQFRPFAPSVRLADAAALFNMSADQSSPFMLVTFAAKEEAIKKIPGVVHVDGSSRVQTVAEEDNPRYHELLGKFEERTGLPVLLNTSFNRAGEPIVNSPEDAVRCFLAGGMDALVLEDYLVFPE